MKRKIIHLVLASAVISSLISCEAGDEVGTEMGVSFEDELRTLHPKGLQFEKSAVRKMIFKVNVPQKELEANYPLSGFSEDTNKVRGKYTETDGTLLIATTAGTFDLPIKCRGFFSGYTKISSIVGMEHLRTEQVAFMNLMFEDCMTLISLNLSSFNTENVRNMDGMFKNCMALTRLNLSSFNTKKVTSMSFMFNNCKALRDLDLKNFYTERVVYMDHMFEGCIALHSLNIVHFSTENVSRMNDIFRNCPNLVIINKGSKFRYK